MKIEKAYYIKLGEAGTWEADALATNKIRFGWRDISLNLLIREDWSTIRSIIDNDFLNRGKKNGATNDFNSLRNICSADENTVFITFHAGKMFWCIAKNSSLGEDSISKFLETSSPWSCTNILGTRTFEISQISGRLTKFQLFMGTCCSVGNRLREIDYLVTILNGNESEEYKDLNAAKENLKRSLIPAIKNLVPKDFEILIDLIFRNSGWKRTSVLGEVMKFFDLVLEEPFTKKLYGVQIKSESSYKQFADYSTAFISDYSGEFEKLFYAVHTADRKLDELVVEDQEIELLRIPRIADLCIDAGLVSWIMEKSR